MGTHTRFLSLSNFVFSAENNDENCNYSIDVGGDEVMVVLACTKNEMKEKTIYIQQVIPSRCVCVLTS